MACFGLCAGSHFLINHLKYSNMRFGIGGRRYVPRASADEGDRRADANRGPERKWHFALIRESGGAGRSSIARSDRHVLFTAQTRRTNRTRPRTRCTQADQNPQPFEVIRKISLFLCEPREGRGSTTSVN